MEKVTLMFIFLLGARLAHGKACSDDAEGKMKNLTAPISPWSSMPPPIDCRISLPVPPPLDCSKSIQAAITTTDGKTMFFQEDWFWAVQMDGSMVDGYPRPITTDWLNAPTNLDAALSLWDDRVFFLKGDMYWRYDNYVPQPGYPKKISDGFCGVESDIMSAAYWLETMTMCFFKGDKVFSYSGSETQKKRVQGYSLSPSWKGLPSNMDAALTWFNKKLYFFKGDQYWRYDEDGVNSSKYPQPRVPAWGESCEDLNKRIENLYG